jgi:DNA-binding HxlR family transcriptional regulator
MNSVPSQASCDAIGKLLATITRRWTLHILWILISEGPTHFGALRRKVHGISARVLTVRLRALEARGLVYRELTAACPPEAIYGLTKMAAEIGALLEELHHVATRWEADLSNRDLLPDNKSQPMSLPRFARQARG